MSTRELIEAEIEHLNEEQLEKLYEVVREMAKAPKTPAAPSLMSKLKQVQIEAPEDFATNLDLYVSGEKRVS